MNQWPVDCSESDCDAYKATWTAVGDNMIKLTVQAAQEMGQWIAVGFSSTPTMVSTLTLQASDRYRIDIGSTSIRGVHVGSISIQYMSLKSGVAVRDETEAEL